jgi:uncharacterized protein YraI
MRHMTDHSFPKEILKYIALALMLLLGTRPGAHAQERVKTYSVTGIARNDTLRVRSSPGEKFAIVAKLPNGVTGIQIVGQTVMNGSDDWVPITVSGIKGWARPMYLAADVRGALRATAVEESSVPEIAPVPDSSTVIAAPNVNRALLADSEPATRDSNSGLALFVLAIIALCALGAAKKKPKEQLRPNQCPKCKRDTLETRQKFFGGSYRRCTRTILCQYNENKQARPERTRSRDPYGSEERARGAIIQWQAENSIAQSRGEPLPHPGAPR